VSVDRRQFIHGAMALAAVGWPDAEAKSPDAVGEEAPPEREITSPVAIADGDGRLNRDAVGWARQPIFDCRFAPGVSRVERFNYWCITSREAALTLLVADVGLAGAAMISLVDYAVKSPVERKFVRVGGLPFAMPDTPTGDVAIDVRHLRLDMRQRDSQLVITGAARTHGSTIDVDLTVDRPPEHETVNVLVPWGDTRYHLTSKQQALPARGVVRVDGREYRFGPENQGFACMDFGRGRRPRGIDWCWAFASATIGGRTIGMNLGARWTDGTGVTENGLVVDHRLHKIADAVDFDVSGPVWRIRTRTTGRVDLAFEPRWRRGVHAPPFARLVQQMGSYSGTLIDDDGAPVVLDDVVGLAETVHGRW
jgi:hypothetical protein